MGNDMVSMVLMGYYNNLYEKLVAADGDALDGLLADEFMAEFEDRELVNKADFIEDFTSGKVRYYHVRHKRANIKLFDDDTSALLTAKSEVDCEMFDKERGTRLLQAVLELKKGQNAWVTTRMAVAEVEPEPAK